MITLHCGDTEYEINVDDASYRYRALMEKPQLVLKFSLPVYIDIPVGAWCEFQNEKYVLRYASDLKKGGTRDIEYDMTMGQDEDYLGLYKLRNSVDGRLEYSMCATPAEFAQEIVDNLNSRDGDGTWSVGDCLESTEKTVEFNHSYIDEALQDIADTFDTEWEIVDHVVSIHKVEYFKDNPLPLSYGKGNGFVPGVGRSAESDDMPIKRIYTQGGERNIDRSTYGSSELLLPKSQTLKYDGTLFETDDGFDGTSEEVRTYQSDEDGYYIERIDEVSDAVKEDSLDCSDIYPSRVGTVTAVEVADADKNYYDIIDDTIPSSLNFNDYVIAGETATIIFQSGMLAGDDKEFEFTYKHAERRFEFVPQEIDGITMPNETYAPAVGDTYAVFGVSLPDEYVCDNDTKTGASWKMFREAARSLYENEEQKFTFSGELQGLWARRNWANIGGYMKPGAYIRFSDTQFAPDGVDIRITGIKEYVNSPYSPTIEISNSVTGGNLSSALREIESQEVAISETAKSIIRFTKRRFRDALETIEMLNESLLDFSEAVNPITVQTMALLIGDESLQFRFVNGLDDLTVDTSYQITYDNEAKQLHCPHGYLQHMTLGIDSISSSHADSEYKVWEMGEFLSGVLTETDTKYYLYAVVDREDCSVAGHFELQEKAVAMDDVDGCYYLLTGVLNSESNGERSYVDLYGFTEILPGRITTDKIVSSDGVSFIDLVNNAMHLGGSGTYMDWNNEEEGTLVLNNATVKERLNVLDEAYVAGFIFSDTLIKSSATEGSDPAFYLDGVNGKIRLNCPTTGGDYSLDDSASEIDIDATSGRVRAENDNGVAYLSASGVFCNNAKTKALSMTTGYTHYGAIVGLGFGDVDKSTWQFDSEQTILAGVYGRASNDGTAPAYGGYFWDLVAAGLILRTKYIFDSAATTAVELSGNYSQVIGLTNSGVTGTVYLPSEDMEGKVIFAKQIGQGTTRFYPMSGQKIFDDSSENEYYDMGEGQEMKFTFAIYKKGIEIIEVWLVSRWKF